MNGETFTVRFSDGALEQGHPVADNEALRDLANKVGARLTNTVVVRVGVEKSDLTYGYEHTDGSELNRREESAVQINRMTTEELIGRRLSVTTPEVTTGNLTRELARLLFHHTYLNAGAKRRERMMERRQTAIIALSMGVLVTEAFVTHFQNGLLSAFIVGGGVAAGVVNQLQHRKSLRRPPQLAADLRPPITVLPHNSEL